MKIEILNFKLSSTEKMEHGSLIGTASALINNCIVVQGIRMMRGKKGIFIAMPSYKTEKDGKEAWVDITYLKQKEFQEALREEMKKAYVKAVEREEHQIAPFSITLTPLPGRADSLRAIGNIEVDGLVIRNVKLMEANGRMFVSMPQYKDSEGKWHYLVYPSNADMRMRIENAFVEEYKKRTQTTARETPVHEAKKKQEGTVKRNETWNIIRIV